MNTKELTVVATEVNEVFNNLSSDILGKIPTTIIKFFKDNVSDSYVFIYDKTKSLKEQKLNPKTKGVLAFLYKEYICDSENKEEYDKVYREFIIEWEKQKASFEPEKLFQGKNKKNEFVEALPTKVVSEKWYVKVLKCIKNKFSK